MAVMWGWPSCPGGEDRPWQSRGEKAATHVGPNVPRTLASPFASYPRPGQAPQHCPLTESVLDSILHVPPVPTLTGLLGPGVNIDDETRLREGSHGLRSRSARNACSPCALSRITVITWGAHKHSSCTMACQGQQA